MNTVRSEERERCWITHRRPEIWTTCPLCRKPIRWVRLWNDKWSPCDEEPVLFLRKSATTPGGGRWRKKIVRKREILEDCAIYNPSIDQGARPETGRIPHFYTCPVLKQERREWAIANRKK